ncbi:hypothetical protein WMY93_009136 [Mugilogobius chulae]|uniref:SEC24 homolog B, COPII coat complex component n=1 Tax=Mugilogobius chulae TaxID=88201 RepID=A0AAW0PAN7_9GOBI
MRGVLSSTLGACEKASGADDKQQLCTSVLPTDCAVRGGSTQSYPLMYHPATYYGTPPPPHSYPSKPPLSSSQAPHYYHNSHVPAQSHPGAPAVPPGSAPPHAQYGQQLQHVPPGSAPPRAQYGQQLQHVPPGSAPPPPAAAPPHAQYGQQPQQNPYAAPGSYYGHPQPYSAPPPPQQQQYPLTPAPVTAVGSVSSQYGTHSHSGRPGGLPVQTGAPLHHYSPVCPPCGYGTAPGQQQTVLNGQAHGTASTHGPYSAADSSGHTPSSTGTPSPGHHSAPPSQYGAYEGTSGPSEPAQSSSSSEDEDLEEDDEEAGATLPPPAPGTASPVPNSYDSLEGGSYPDSEPAPHSQPYSGLPPAAPPHGYNLQPHRYVTAFPACPSCLRLWGPQWVPELELESLQPINLLQERCLLPPRPLGAPEPNLSPELQKVNCSPEAALCCTCLLHGAKARVCVCVLGERAGERESIICGMDLKTKDFPLYSDQHPPNQALLNKARLPLGLLLHPFRDLQVPPHTHTPAGTSSHTCRYLLTPAGTSSHTCRYLLTHLQVPPHTCRYLLTHLQYLLTPAGTSSHLQVPPHTPAGTSSHTCRYLLTPAGTSSHLQVPPHTPAGTSSHTCRYLLTHLQVPPHTCRYLLTHLQVPPHLLRPAGTSSHLQVPPHTCRYLLTHLQVPLHTCRYLLTHLQQLPVITSNTIVRCRSCRTYINPSSPSWTSGGGSVTCATGSTMLRPPQPAVYLFVLDVSHNAVEAGYLKYFCDCLLENLDSLPGDARTRVGFLTFDSTIHFYNLQDGLSQPHMLVVSDIDDVFIPSHDNLMVSLKESKELVKELLTSLPSMFAHTRETQSALGPALQAAYKLMSPTGGRVSVFQSQLPTLGAGQLQSREDPNQRSSTKVVQHLGPATDFYKKLALDCSGQQIGVDLFLLSSQYSDLSSLACMSKYSAGSIFYYPSFHHIHNPAQLEKFQRDLERYLTRKIGFEAVMRIRCTKGLSIHTFHGNLFVRSTDLLSLANVNPDSAFAVQMSIDDSLADSSLACFQAALLYTSSKGKRRIRVHTLCLPVVTQLSDVYAGADVQAVTCLLANMAIDRSVSSGLSDARDALVNAVVDLVCAYRSSVSSLQQSGLVLPSSMRLFPLYILALLKQKALRTGTSTRLDERVFAMCQFKSEPLPQLLRLLHPDLYRLDSISDQGALHLNDTIVPQPQLLHLSAERLSRDGAFLLDCGSVLYMWVGRSCSDMFLRDVLGVSDYASLPPSMNHIPELLTPLSERIRAFLDWLQENRSCSCPLHVIRDDSSAKNIFFQHLVEDSSDSGPSYHDFLQQILQQASK